MSNERTEVTTAPVRALLVVSWIWVGVPFAYGTYSLLAKLPGLFH